MSEVTDSGGQNWLIMPAARAVNEAAPANISRQRWLLVLSGVAIVNVKGKTSGDWLQDQVHICRTCAARSTTPSAGGTSRSLREPKG